MKKRWMFSAAFLVASAALLARARRSGASGAANTTIPYRQENHGTFDEEWLPHEGVSGWWYATGYLHDVQGTLYTFQYTVSHPFFYGRHAWLAMMALTDITHGKHYYQQHAHMFGEPVTVTPDSVDYQNVTQLRKDDTKFKIKVHDKTVNYDLTLDKGKGAFWHCDDGVLTMGVQDERSKTMYYSYTNMPTTGTIEIDGKTIEVQGKSWFDRQWGPYDLMDSRTNWEWFSFRFFDDEEIMLFAFPQVDYYDGTYITKGGERQRLNKYTLKQESFTSVHGMKFSDRWTVTMPGVKDEYYELRPLTKGQFNLAYFEELTGIYTRENELVGYAFVELLPGVWNADQSKPAMLWRMLRSASHSS